MEVEEIKTKPHKQLVVVSKGQVFISLDNLNSDNFWSLITNHWSMIKRQMEAFCQAVHAAMEADCCCEDPEELHHIWDWICVVEYSALCGKNIKIKQPCSITSEVVYMFCKHLFQLKLLSNEAEETSPHQLVSPHSKLTTCLFFTATKKHGKGKAEEEKSPSTIKHKAELALQRFYISSSPSNIANTITSLKSSAYSSSMPTSEPLVSGFDVLIFSHKRVNMSAIWHPLASDTIPEPFCYLHHIPIPHPMCEVVCSAPAFLTAQSLDRTLLHIGLYSFLIQSLELPNPSPHPITSPTTPYHILYEANPTYYLSFCATLYSSFVCLSSTPIAEGNISSLTNWLLTFHSKFLEESDLTAITSFLQLTSHPALGPLTPKTSSSSSSGPWKVWKSIG
ncbi:uncharacterized protein ACA1_397520 [Acanthamoeba castellanii str. Neff]|uniref:Uncharacterized protein n=1 Tax=Acanthamoeba castellanii (strain ATCC 30010 / Neff) TaxID=1257118 RepID=L8HEP7_ACACF|nr:uncharacterized protein ACA1_397520 [Acanthamoeba castellanii str. Neff]ELR22886.1 hypothetical protein ACA1_397520 [Acanthamoeba castellanii str. Neff]